MATYKKHIVLEYPINEVFRVFRKTAKRDFRKFNEENAVGTSMERSVTGKKGKSEKMLIEITDYKPEEVYEVTSTRGNTTYKSRYEFHALDSGKTKILLTESNYTPGSIEILNTLIVSVFFRGRLKNKFNAFIEGLKGEIENNLKNDERSKPKLKE